MADLTDTVRVLRSVDQSHDAKLIEDIVLAVRKSAAAYLEWLSHEDAKLRSDRSDQWLRDRFPEWERNGNAKRDEKRNRWYRRLVIPLRAHTHLAYEQGKKEGLAGVT